jgi:hypothetical protein
VSEAGQRWLMLVAIVGVYACWQWRHQRRAAPPGQAWSRTTAEVPALLAIVIGGVVGDHLWPDGPPPLFDRTITPGFALGTIAGVLASEPLRRTTLRLLGIAPEPRR